jgi:hypothetical protein
VIYILIDPVILPWDHTCDFCEILYQFLALNYHNCWFNYNYSTCLEIGNRHQRTQRNVLEALENSAQLVCSQNWLRFRNDWLPTFTYKGISKSFRTGRLEREPQMIQLSATRCSCIAILWVSLVSFAAMTLCVASQRVYCCKHIFRYRLSPETFGYILVQNWFSLGTNGGDLAGDRVRNTDQIHSSMAWCKILLTE